MEMERRNEHSEKAKHDVYLVDLGGSFSFQNPLSQSSVEPDSYSNEYLLAKFGFDTAENEPCQNSNFLTVLTPEF